MSATGSVRGFSEFDDLCKGHQGYSYNLAELFNSCDIEKRHRHNIGFKEALKRLKAKIKGSFLELHIQSGRQITEFTIGKTFVKQRIGVTFNTMKPTTWSLGGGINGRWQDYKKENYNGLIVLGCVERDLIPLDVKSNKYMEINQQTYALGLEQALIQYFSLYKPDNRLRNKSFDIGNLSKDPYKGGIIYVAYKLEPDMDLEYSDNEMDIKAELEKHALDDKRSALGRLRILLEQNGMYFSGSSSLDGDSFFKACSDQLNILGMPCMDHVTLRKMVTQLLRLTPINDANFTAESWTSYIDKLSNEGEYVCERVVEKMATILDRQITIYLPLYPDGIDEISYNKQASNRGSPLLLAREKLCYQSLRKGEEGNTSTIIDPLTTKKRPANVTFARPESSMKQAKVDSPGASFKTEPKMEPEPKTTTDKQTNIHQVGVIGDSTHSVAAKIDIQPNHGSETLPAPSTSAGSVFSTKESKIASPNQEKTAQVKRPKILKMTVDEKRLILKSYIGQEIKSDWNKLSETVYNVRHEKLSRKTIEHYEKHLDHKSRTDRIKYFIQKAKRGKCENEQDPEIRSLIASIVDT